MSVSVLVLVGSITDNPTAVSYIENHTGNSIYKVAEQLKAPIVKGALFRWLVSGNDPVFSLWLDKCGHREVHVHIRSAQKI